ncbi:hypothetical protein HNY73_014191 [Argiope bruennichi]|uniref:Transposable element P transposase-like RNase H domain-containing protein n=1 Tax=Argiope bruennichi TaxID=94029 RepID=A0A8T0ENH6_ARGBR|nr:hypothetical protein HNY73_014191 [Argiope bruennichi]
MDANAGPCATPNKSSRKFSVSKFRCCLCCRSQNETPGLILFKFPSDESSTLRLKLTKFAYPHVEEDLPSTFDDILSAQASHLPTVHLLQYTYYVAKTSGFCPKLVNCLKKKSSHLSEAEKLCLLLIDEMAIKQGLTYATYLDAVDGFTSVRNYFQEKSPYATQVLVFMACRIVKNWQQV